MLNVAVIGLGGFAGEHHRAVAALEAEGVCRLVACADPGRARMGDEIARYRLIERGVAMYDTLDDLLAAGHDLDVVGLPTPIHLHAEQHAACVARGLAVYLEKPPTLWPPELEEMIARDNAAPFATHVGFNFVGDPFRLALLDRIRSGEFGPLRTVTLRGTWPRDDAYYARNNWAGREWVHGRPVFDSPIGNALAHYVQNVLMWADSDVVNVEAQLFRAREIETFDTVFAQATMANGVTLRLGVTHTFGENFQRETLVFDAVTITSDAWDRIGILQAGVEARGTRLGEEMLRSDWTYPQAIIENFRAYFEYVRGERAAPVTPLTACRNFVALHADAYATSGGGHPFDPERVTDHNGCRMVAGLADELDRFVEDGVWPSSSQ